MHHSYIVGKVRLYGEVLCQWIDTTNALSTDYGSCCNRDFGQHSEILGNDSDMLVVVC